MRVYLTHLQHEADKMHIAFVFRSSLELLVENRMGQGPVAAAHPAWSPLRRWQQAGLSSLQRSWAQVMEPGKGPSAVGRGSSLTCGEGGRQDEGDGEEGETVGEQPAALGGSVL